MTRMTGLRATVRSVGPSAIVKALVLPVSAVLGILNTRLIIDNLGLAAYAQFGLLVTLGNLLPFADLGLSAAVMNAVGGSEDPRADAKVRQVLVSCFRVLFVSCLVLIALTAVITVVGGWPVLLGDGLVPGTGPVTAALCLGVIAVTLLVSPGQRVLTGLGRNQVAIGLLGLQTPIVLGVVAILVAAQSPLRPFIAVVPYLALLLLQLLIFVLAGRAIDPTLRQAVADVPKLREVRGARVGDVAWPMLILMIGTVVAMQSDRLVLSHLSTAAELAEYNLAAQIFLPVLHVVSAAGFSLWPIFARQRARQEAADPLPTSLLFGAVAALGCLVLGVASPWLTGLASGGQVSVGLATIGAFSAVVVFQALKYPLGIYLTDADGLRFQVWLLVATLPLNLLLSLALAQELGAVGPLIGSALAVAVQYVACLIRIRVRSFVEPRLAREGRGSGGGD